MSPSPTTHAARDDGAPLPARFGRYLLLEHVATGGMADVYRAVAPGAAGVSKAVCIKRIREGRLQDPRLVALFIDEARISIQLSHPNIVHTFDFGRVGDEYFLALEFVDGLDLAKLLDAAGRLEAPEVAMIGESLGRALSHAHSRVRPDGTPLGLVHRDVTPRNVLVTPEGDVKLADFGVARLRTDAAEGLRGTVRYMAPEQATRGVVDARADVFALGLVLIECLRGEPAYAGTPDEVLEKARRGIVELGRRGDEGPIEASLLDTIARATAPSPQDRYDSAAALAEALGRIVAQARASGADDPRASLARLVGGRGATAGSIPAGDVPPDRRPAAYYTVDGSARDFEERLGATEASEAETVASEAAAEPPRARGTPGRRVGLAIAGMAVVAIVALVASSTGGVGSRAGRPPRSRGDAATTERARPAPPRPAAAKVVATEPPAAVPEAPPVAPPTEREGSPPPRRPSISTPRRGPRSRSMARRVAPRRSVGSRWRRGRTVCDS